MKKLLYSILVGMLAFTLGCEEPDEVKYTVADGFAAQQGVFTVLDEEGTVYFNAANPDVSQLTIEHLRTVNVVYSASEGEVILDTVDSQGEFATVNISDGAGSMTITRDDVQFDDAAFATSWVEFSSTANIEGNPVNSFSVTLQDPMQSLMGPYIWTTNEDGDPVTEDVTVYHNDDVQYIKYNIVRNGASLTSMTLEEKIGANGDYSEVTDVDLNTDANDDGAIIDSIEVVGTDYSYGDTVYYKFIPESNFSLPSYLPSQNYEVSVPINKLAFGETGSFTLDSVPNKAWDLVNNKMIVDTANYDSADVAVDFTGTQLGIVSSDRTEFVATSADIDYTNIEEVIDEFESNTPQSSITGLEVDDLILYKIQRNSEEHYGTLIVDEAWINSSNDNYLLTLTYHNN